VQDRLAGQELCFVQQRKVRFAADFEIDRWSAERLLEVKRDAEVTAELELNFA